MNYQHTLDTLEFPKVIMAVAGHCRTPYGSELVRALTPLPTRRERETRLSETAQMLDIVRFGDPFPLQRVPDCRETLERAAVQGGFIEPLEFLALAELLGGVAALAAYAPDRRDNFPAVNTYLERLKPHPSLRSEIHKTIDETGEVRDTASGNLQNIRRELADSRRRLISKLEGLLVAARKPSSQSDDVVTQRNGRYVMTVPSNSYRTDIGILHDRSASGATLYVEPKEAVELNNRLQSLLQEERREIDRILRALTGQVRAVSDDLTQNMLLLGHLDLLYASAEFGTTIHGQIARLADSATIRLSQTRHPLLVRQFGSPERVVPADVQLDESRQAILITGPNTGGKTVLLKSIGLSILMTYTGLPISAARESEIGEFAQLFADIGDEQSLELSLSTFSSHVRNIAEALGSLSERTLLLFDEVGAGTDPKDGAALAEAVLLYAIKKSARIVATTHYSQLKTLALDHPEIENASMEFDLDTLSPTYRLRMGLPGSSYGIQIATRLGLPAEVCSAAQHLVGDEERSLTRLISSLEDELARLREDRIALQERLQRAEEDKSRIETRLVALEDEINKRRTEALGEVESLLVETRRQMEQEVATIRQTQADEAALKAFHREVGARKKKVDAIRAKTTPKRTVGTYQKGESVRISSLNASGVVDEVLSLARYRVRVGNVVTTVDARNLEPAGSSVLPTPRTAAKRQQVSPGDGFSPEIHLRGMTVDEATEALEKFIDSAVVAGMHQIYVIHGKGTGTLRRTLTSFLRSHPEVSSLRLGDWNEGGAGVTIVKLKG